MNTWPFGNKTAVDTKDAIDLIVRVSLPTVHRRIAKKQVRETIRYAAKQNHIVSWKWRDGDAWTWAANKWPEISQLQGFPWGQSMGATVALFGQRVGVTSGYLYGTPSDPQELLAEYAKAHERIDQLLQENRQLLQKKVEMESWRREVEPDLEAYRDSEAKKHWKRSRCAREGWASKRGRPRK